MTDITVEEYNGYTITTSYDEYTDFEDYVSNYDGMFATFSPVDLGFPEHYEVDLDHAFERFDENPETMRRYLAIFHPEYTVFPLYKYDHSAVSYSVGNPDTPAATSRTGYRSWDTSTLGYIAMKDSQFFDTPERKKDYLDSVMKEFSDVSNGNVYSYLVEHPEEGTIDSLGGFVGSEDDALEDARREVDAHISFLERQEAMRQESGTYTF
jgi:hypothetical protein